MITTPEAPIAASEAGARRIETPCGDGMMVWRRWGSGPPLVLFHGGFGAWTHWVRNIGPLAKRFTVYAPDLPGFGDSADPKHPIDFPHIVEAVVPGLRALMPRELPFDLVAFSFGGNVAALVAAELGTQVRNLVLVGSGGFGPNQRTGTFVAWRDVSDPEALAAAHRHNLHVQMIADPSKIDALAVAIQTANTQRARTRSPNLHAANLDLMRKTLPRVAARLHGIWGERDATAGAQIEERGGLLGAIQPGATFTVIPGAGHWVAYEAADAFNAELFRRIG